MAALQQPLADFDPEAPVPLSAGLFGFNCHPASAALVLLPVPWEATASFRRGTAQAPDSIRMASHTMDHHDEELGELWRQGIALDPSCEQQWHQANVRALLHTDQVFEELDRGASLADPHLAPALEAINAECEQLAAQVQGAAEAWLAEGQQVGMLGGDHSVPLGLLQALDTQGAPFGVLQIDAHADLRPGYLGMTYAHAAIMHHALLLPRLERLVQVGIRDQSPLEARRAAEEGQRVQQFTDAALAQAQFDGSSWASQCEAILKALPRRVYVSVDIDGLAPALAPQTGTPVPGGLSFQQLRYLLQALRNSGRQIIGFDLCEVSASSGAALDAIVGAHVLWRLALESLATNQSG
jgi:agmatinase